MFSRTRHGLFFTLEYPRFLKFLFNIFFLASIYPKQPINIIIFIFHLLVLILDDPNCFQCKFLLYYWLFDGFMLHNFSLFYLLQHLNYLNYIFSLLPIINSHRLSNLLQYIWIPQLLEFLAFLLGPSGFFAMQLSKTVITACLKEY